MAKRIAVVSGTALVPGVSKNGRLYTREVIANAVARAQERVDHGTMALRDHPREAQPLTQRTHHDANDDSAAIVGMVSGLTLGDDGSAKFTADIADTPKGRTIASLADTSDGRPAFLRGVSIRGAWIGEPKRTSHDGQYVETGDLELFGLDYTANPGVAGAIIDSCLPVNESTGDGRVAIYESVQEARVEVAVEEKGAPALKSGKPAAAPTPGASNYADPGYQDDKAKRYPLDTKAHAKAAWSYVNQAKNAKAYTAPQLKRIKGRIRAALTKFGVKITAEHWLVDPVVQVTESGFLDAETGVVIEDYYPDSSTAGSFSISLSNGPVNVTVSSYQVDPADLDLIGRAAMDGACKALASIDPDMDGDMDVPGAEREDTDRDMGGETDGHAGTSGNAVAETDPESDSVRELDLPPDSGDPDGSSGVPDPLPAPDVPAADPTPQEEPAMADEPTPAVDPAAPTEPAPTPTAPDVPADPPPAADPAAGGAVTMSDAQFAAMLAALRAPVSASAESAPAPAPAAVPAVVPTPVATETTEQMIARLVSEGVKSALPLAVQEHVQLAGVPGRKGLVVRRAAANEADAAVTPSVDGLNEYGVPADWPNKPLDKYSPEERRKFFGPAIRSHYLGDTT